MLGALAKVSGLTLISRLLGFVRDLMLAHLFGADARTDAFFVAFKIPDFLRRLFSEGAFATAFVPLLVDYQVRRGPEELKTLVATVGGTLGLVLLLLTLLGVVVAPLLVVLFAPGFLGDAGQQSRTVDMLRLTLPYLLFIPLTAFAGALLNVHQRFVLPAFTPVLLNLVLIGCALWLAPRMTEPITALAWGVLIGGVAQLTVQLPFLGQLGLLPRLRFDLRHPGLRRLFGSMPAALFGVSVTQINLFLDNLIASFLTSGSISWLYYSDRLVEFPLGMLGVALGTVILPRLSHQHALESSEDFSRAIDWGLRWVLLLGLPAAVGLLVLSGPLVATLFHSTQFDAHDVTMTQRSLMAYASGLLAFIAIKVLAPGYYARQDNRTPLRIGVKSLLANLVLSLLLLYPLTHAGLALATSLAAWLNAVLLYRGLRQQGVYRPLPGWGSRIRRILAASAIMGLLLVLGAAEGGDWIEMLPQARIGQLSMLILGGSLCYFFSLWLLGIHQRDFLDFPDSIHARRHWEP
jgi:putative peptidoglycan lipid II flippase